MPRSARAGGGAPWVARTSVLACPWAPGAGPPFTETASAMTYKWWVVVMLWFVCLFNYADRQAIYSVFPLLQSEMGLSDMQLGIVGGAFMWVYALALPLAGLVGDRVSRKALI